MPQSKAEAIWEGTLKDGNGNVNTQSGRCSEPYTFESRFKNGEGTSPEELIGAAHAGCVSMALSHALAEEGYEPKRVHTKANVTLEEKADGFKITAIDLETEATVPDLEVEEFQKFAETAKTTCPVSQALTGTTINMNARLTR
ncbi:OsmC family peroxiredoxin [candidate division GN15 bacterium]|nr:OsmC family peroxiredoxin [candidate division GN15 bacterium]